ncbi:hypothetical protein NFHSH190041_17970 [Shewanella sp. NFH-SH190041]|uniref:hypothetical protein n=1 Tax=Shewanella sp. NFH-SH190041 TaxID=2950245 RepID=UPI0021C26617|nr:hypothetical protein [Shewanella sp. NFH-SH190041]BDM64345.1 hypothetical protein NFHSH190041_17970 [Shewanella sp. NFH-SH190041]
MTWQYHGEAPRAGRKLLLLQVDEIRLAVPMLYRMLDSDVIKRKPDWFSVEVVHSQRLTDLTIYHELVDALRELVAIRKIARSDYNEQLVDNLKQVNLLLNQFFSDLGWREVRKEISQLKKRQKKAHIEVSRDIIDQLKRYMEQHCFDSFDQALDSLLMAHTESEIVLKNE